MAERVVLWFVASVGYVGAVLPAVLAFRLRAWHQAWQCRVQQGKVLKAHRVSHELHVGPIPAGLDIDHLCRVRHCVNPEHLQPVTRRENVLRGEGLAAVHAVKTHCPQGHEYDEANTYRSPG